jgi:sialidase-1
MFCCSLLAAGHVAVAVLGSAPTPSGPVSVFALGEANASAYRLPGVVAFRGAVLAFGVQRTRGCADHKSGVHNVVMKRSTDAGRTFGNLTTVVDTVKVWGQKAAVSTSMGGVATNPTPVVDETTGELMLFFSHTNASMEHATHKGNGPTWEYTWFYPDATTSYVMTSVDGDNWSPPRTLASHGARTPLCSVTPAGGHGVQLASGRLLVPGYHLKKCTKIDAEVVEQAHAWISDPVPAGTGPSKRRWEISDGFGTGVAEPSFVELFTAAPWQSGSSGKRSDGGADAPLAVRATFRVDAPSSCHCQSHPPNGSSPTPPTSGAVRKCRRTAVSTDQGRTFGNWWDQGELPDPGCKGGYTRASEFNAIVVANDANSNVRENITISISLDGGLTFPHKRVMWPAKAGYVDLMMVSSSEIGILYENDGCSMDFMTVDVRNIISGR